MTNDPRKSVMGNNPRECVVGNHLMRALRVVVVVSVLVAASLASALPIELKDQNGTRYNINTAVDPLITNSNASGAITNATYVKAVTVTNYYLGLTDFGFFFTTYTTQHQVNVPLTPAFAGFNGLLITGIDGVALPNPIVFNPGEALASEDCPQNNTNQQLNFQTQTLPGLNLQVTRKVFVSKNSEFVRWLNIVTNTDSTAREVGITLTSDASGTSDLVVEPKKDVTGLARPSPRAY